MGEHEQRGAIRLAKWWKLSTTASSDPYTSRWSASTLVIAAMVGANGLGIPVVRPKVTETTALGAAYLAGLATGLWQDAAEISSQWQVDRRFEPQLGTAARRAKLTRWRQAVERSKAWADN